MQTGSGLALSAGGMAGGRPLAPCPLRAATAFRGTNAVQPPSARRRLVCQARDKGVGPLLRKGARASRPPASRQRLLASLNRVGLCNQTVNHTACNSCPGGTQALPPAPAPQR